MTTATDWEPGTWTDTGELAVVTDVTSAPTDTPFLPEVPPAVAFYREPTRAEIAAEPTPEAGDHIPGTDDLTRRIDLTLASYRLVLRSEYKAKLWREVASDAWAHQGEMSRISDTYRTKAETTERHYREQCRQIWGMAYHGVLSMTPEPALPVSAEGERFLAQGPAPAEGFDTTAALGKLTGRVKTAVTGATNQAAAQKPRSPWWRRVWRKAKDSVDYVLLGALFVAWLAVVHFAFKGALW